VNELALFAGAGGGILGGKLLGWRTVCAVEWDAYAASILVARQNDGHLPPFPIWDDVQTFDGNPWRGIVDVVSGGFPCQDISAAGKGAGIDGERSGMWSHMARIIGEVRPRFAFVENSPMLTSRGLGTVLGDLATLGYDARWAVLGAADTGAPHQRDRIWIVAKQRNIFSHAQHNRNGRREQQSEGVTEKNVSNAASDDDKQLAGKVEGDWSIEQRRQAKVWSESTGLCENVANSKCKGLERLSDTESVSKCWSSINGSGCLQNRAIWWEVEPNVGRVADGVAARMDRLKAIGNGQVSAVAALAWETLT
jgi:DNA (cytosine-5)-methyltransferase 1